MLAFVHCRLGLDGGDDRDDGAWRRLRLGAKLFISCSKMQSCSRHLNSFLDWSAHEEIHPDGANLRYTAAQAYKNGMVRNSTAITVAIAILFVEVPGLTCESPMSLFEIPQTPPKLFTT